MGLDFSKTSSQQPTVTTTPAPQEEMVVQSYDIVADRNQMNAELINSAEVDALVSTIEVNNMESIVTFGAHAAEEISKASDIVLNSMNMAQLDESSQMLTTLAKIMDKFDIEEIKENPGLFGKLFGNLRKKLDRSSPIWAATCAWPLTSALKTPRPGTMFRKAWTEPTAGWCAARRKMPA